MNSTSGSQPIRFDTVLPYHPNLAPKANTWRIRITLSLDATSRRLEIPAPIGEGKKAGILMETQI